MSRSLAIILLFLFCLPLTAQAQETPGGEGSHPELTRTIDRILAESDLPRTVIGIHVEDLSTGNVLYSRNSDRLMNPASNMKLVTAAAILEVLGPNHVVRTELRTEKREGAKIENLYIRGGGEAFLVHRDILAWASELRQQGIEEITGDVIIDDTIFRGDYLPPGFDQRPSDAAWRSMIGAISVNFNAVQATVLPGPQVGTAARVRLDPPNEHIQIVNRVTTVRGSLGRVNVSAEAYGEGTRLVITGTIGANASPVSMRRRIDNPPAFAGSVIAMAMRQMGITFRGQVRQGRTAEKTERIFVHDSQPIMNSISGMNKWSNNFMAEQMLRFLGVNGSQPSTWDASIRRATQAIQEGNIISGPFTIHNGSGLYDGNLVSPRQVVGLLSTMRNHRYGPEFMASLPIAGVDGTLRHRLEGDLTRGNLRAKTGSLRDVSALSGYLQTQSGRMVAFSIIFNDPPRPAWGYRSYQDRIAEAIARIND